MRTKLYSFLTNSISVLLVVVAFIYPILFLNLTTNYYDIPKLIFLTSSSVILLGLWILSWISKGKVEITRTPLDIPFLILLATLVASTWFSTSRYSSIFGAVPEVHGSIISWVTYIIIYFVAASNLKTNEYKKIFLYTLSFSALATAVLTVFAFFEVFLPIEMAQGVNFTPTGSSFSTIALLLLLIPFLIGEILDNDSFAVQVTALIIVSFFIISTVIIGGWLHVGVLGSIFFVFFLINRKSLSGERVQLLFVPVFTLLIISLAVFIPINGNIVHNLKTNYPQAVQLPPSTTWQVSASAFRDAPLVGTGPATFLFNFTNYRPIEFNRFNYWNFSFSSGYNEYLEILGTWGLFGVISIMVISLIILRQSLNGLSSALNQKLKNTTELQISMSVAGVLVVLLLIIHSSTLVSITTSMFILALLFNSSKKDTDTASEYGIGIKLSASEKNQLDLLPVIIFVIFIIASVPLSGYIYKFSSADYYHRLALSQASVDGTKTYEYLQKSEQLNPYIDLYRVDLAQTNFALANTLAAQKAPTEANPDGSLTAEDREVIQTLISQAINEGRASVVLSPRSAKNWEVLALLYRNITGVTEDAITFSLDAYGRAVQLDPMNPALRVSVGSVYYAIEDYDMAIRFFSDSVNLKPDYVNGYYNLALALRAKGDLDNAQIVAEEAVNILQRDFSSDEFRSGSEVLKQSKRQDFTTASRLLEQIRQEIDSGVAGEGNDAALQNPELPSIDVPSLQEPPETTPPPEIQENPEVNLPDLTE